MSSAKSEYEKEIIRNSLRTFNLFNARDFTNIMDGHTEDYTMYGDTLPEPIVGLEANLEYFYEFTKVFPDIHIFLQNIFTHEDMVVIRFVARGTETNGYMGLPPTNTPFHFHAVFINWFDDEAMRTKTWQYFDSAYILQQIDPQFPAILTAGAGAPVQSPPPAGERARGEAPGQIDPGAGPAAAASPLAALLPPGADPETYKIKTVDHLLRKIANFTFFSMPDKARPNAPILSGGKLVGVEVHENLHRFHVDVKMPRPGGRRLRARNVIGGPTAKVRMQWRPIPDDFVARPGVAIPETPLDPTRSQRFMMHDGLFTMDDSGGSGFRGFGSGRTFPVMVDGAPQLRIAAVVDVVEGFGQIAGHDGLLVVNGYIDPPGGLSLCILLRLTDPLGAYSAEGPIPELVPIPNADPGNVYLIFLGEPDPERPVKINRAADGRMLGATGPQRMRLIDIRFDVRGERGIRSRSTAGQIVGEMNATAWFDPFEGRPPYPFLTTDGVFTFRDRDGRTIGTVEANMTEGRALPTEMRGAPLPVYRVGGMAPFIRGTGCFSEAIGLFTIDSFISLIPNTISGLFVMHLSDPGGKAVDTLKKSWS